MFVVFFFSSRRRHTRFSRDWSSDVCSSDLSTFGQINDGETDYRQLKVLAKQKENLRVLLPLIPWDPVLDSDDQQTLALETRDGRSEERRVGKECRSRWSPQREKKYRMKK